MSARDSSRFALARMAVAGWCASSVALLFAVDERSSTVEKEDE